jgi:hypothetical protein
MRDLDQTAVDCGKMLLLGASLTVGIAAGLMVAFSLIRRLLEFLTL